MPITASILYDVVHCPQRVALDAFGDPARRDEENAFVRLLWERGTLFERETIDKLEEPFLDLSHAAGEEKERLTLEAMQRGEPLIYAGRISADDLLGVPDLLRKETGGYVPGDIKSGAGEERGGDDSDGKPKLHYAVQLALYIDVLERLKLAPGRRGFVWTFMATKSPTTSPFRKDRESRKRFGMNTNLLLLARERYWRGTLFLSLRILACASYAIGTTSA
jgi:predicted RecB family nuclease